MKVLLETASTELNIKNSRFIAEVFPVENQSEAREKLRDLKHLYSDASHVVHAFIVGNKAETCGMSDDGEPSGTAGRPMLDVLRGSGITNILLTVTRYFGGTLLGTGGLVKAYGDSAKEVLNICKTEELVFKKSFTFSCEYSFYDEIKYNLNNYHISNLKEEFLSEVSFSGQIWEEEFNNFSEYIKNFTRGRSEVKCI